MEYFELSQSKSVENALTVMKLDREKYNYRMKKADFEKLDKLKVAYYSGREAEELCDILIEPAYMVSDRLKKVLELYDRGLEFKGIQLFPAAEQCKVYPVYWIPGIQEISCIHETTEKFDNGMLKKLVLDKKEIERYSVFRIGGIQEYKVAVTLPVAESILRRRLYGVSLQKIEVI